MTHSPGYRRKSWADIRAGAKSRSIEGRRESWKKIRVGLQILDSNMCPDEELVFIRLLDVSM